MRARFLIALVLLATSLVPTGVAAQNATTALPNGSANVSNDTLSNATVAEPVEPIDRLTAIESTSVENGQMVLVLRSDVVQRVVLTDAGAVWKGGEVPQREHTLQPGSNRVTIPVTEISGRVAVTIATRRVLYSTVVVTNDPLIGGPFDRGDVQQAALAGLVAGVGVTALIAYKRVRGTSDAPERVL